MSVRSGQGPRLSPLSPTSNFFSALSSSCFKLRLPPSRSLFGTLMRLSARFVQTLALSGFLPMHIYKHTRMEIFEEDNERDRTPETHVFRNPETHFEQTQKSIDIFSRLFSSWFTRSQTSPVTLFWRVCSIVCVCADHFTKAQTKQSHSTLTKHHTGNQLI